ncbi:MAG: response regulator transcription factor [bacterium]
MIRVGIVEDSAGVRRTLQAMLDDTPGFTCICACGSGEEALKVIPKDPPDVVLMDLHLPNLSGIETTERLKQMLPRLNIIMITVYADTDSVFKALRAGAIGYLLKRSSPEEILNAITDVSKGGAPMTSEIARKVVAAFQEPTAAKTEEEGISRREREILEALCQGDSNQNIAAKLSLSIETVRWHLKKIYEKLHVNSRTEAMAKFMSQPRR